MPSPREKIIKNVVTNWLNSEYRFKPSDDQLEKLAKIIIKEINVNEWSSLVESGTRKWPLRAYNKWYGTTGMDRKEKAKHSACGFAHWMSKHYIVLGIKKFWKV